MLIIKNRYLNNYSKKLYRQAYLFNFQSNKNKFFVKYMVFIFSVNITAFLSSILNLKNGRHLKKKKIREELMPAAWHPIRWWNFVCQRNSSSFFSFLILIQMYQNMFLKIFKTICSNILCITNISKPKCFNSFCESYIYCKYYDSLPQKVIHKNLV